MCSTYIVVLRQKKRKKTRRNADAASVLCRKYTHTHLVTWANIAYAARYEALKLFLQGDGVYIPPRTTMELIELLYVCPPFFLTI